jgi:uncharacterized membrane protein (DUF2068 family)
VDWSLFGCGRAGHVTFAPVEPELRARLRAQLADGEAWCCLRCGAFVPGPPDESGPAASAPVVPRGREVRSKLILRLFALERFLRAIIFGVAAFGLWRYRYSRNAIEQAFDRELPVVRDLLRQLGFNIDHSKFVGLLHHALTLSNGSLTLLAAGAAGYAVIEVVEGTGLWLARRWGEYFAMVATSLGLPLEIYDLTRQVSATALVLFAINLALVLYLVITKRLFGIRGGKKAYDARLRSESVLEAARRAVSQTAVSQTAVSQAAGDTAADSAATLDSRSPDSAAAPGQPPDSPAAPGLSPDSAAARSQPPHSAAPPSQTPDSEPDPASAARPARRRV